MMNKKFIGLVPAILCVVIVTLSLAGCASMRLQSLEDDTARGPAQVRQGQDISSKDVTVWGIYKDGSRKVVSGLQIIFDKHTPGPQTVRVRAGILTNQEVSFETEVVALRGLNVASPPKTTIFKQGQNPDPTWPGLEIRGDWGNLGSDKINLKDCAITGIMPNQAGKQTVRVAFEGQVATFDIDFRSMTSIQITQKPTKLDYLQGEPLDLTGIKVVGIWEGFPREDLKVTLDNITGFNANNVGNQHISVNLNGKSAQFDIELYGLTSLMLRSFPTKLTYKVGEQLDLSGIEVEGTYTSSDPSRKKTQFIPESQLSWQAYDPNLIGRQTVILTVNGKATQVTFPITVEAADAPLAPL